MTWKTRKLHEVANIFSGYAFKSSDMDKQEGVPLIKIKNIYSKKVDKNCDTYLNQLAFKKNYQRFFLQKDDFLVAMTGQGSVGRIGKMRSYVEGFLVNQRVGIVRVNKDIADPEFVYQSLATDDTEGMYFNLAFGAGQPNLSPKDIGSANIPFPPLPIQIKIGSLLAAYDNLIENNLKRIKLLEEMAQITYEEWFVSLRFPDHESTPFNPETGLLEGWKKEPLGKHIKFAKGKKVDKLFSEPAQGLERIMLLDSLESGNFKYTTRDKHVPTERGDLVMCMDGARSSYVFYAENGVVGSTMSKIETKTLPVSLLYLFFRSILESLQTNNTGAAIPHANKSYINSIEFSIPSPSVLQQWDIYISKINLQVWNLRDQNQRLREARDILLPRLMTGDIDVEEYDPAQLLKEAA